MQIQEILAIADGATALSVAAGFVIAAICMRETKAFRWWAAGFALLAVALATVTLRMPMPAFWTQSVSWTAFFGAFVTLLVGVNALEDRRILGVGVGAIAAMLLVGIVVFLTRQNAPPPSWYYFGPIPALVLVAAAIVKLDRKKSMDWALALGLLVFSGIIVARSLTFADMFFDTHQSRPLYAGVPQVRVADARLLPGGFRPRPQGFGQPLRPGLRPPPREARHLPPPRLHPGFQRPAQQRFDRNAALGPLPPGVQLQRAGLPPLGQPLVITLVTIAGLLGLAALLASRVALPAMTRLREMSTTDGMTGLLNRRAFDDQCDQVLANSEGVPICAILLDVDHFKRVNDQCGHAAGDRVISNLGDILARAVDQRQIAGRIGGEEFAILLPASIMASAQLFAENVRTQFSSVDFGAEIPWRMTLSAGVAQRRDGESLHALMRRADKALYAAKNGGRDRVVTETDTAGAETRAQFG